MSALLPLDPSSFIGVCITNATPLTVFLTNGVKLNGRIDRIEMLPVPSYVLVRDGHAQLVHIHAVSTVLPS